MTRDNLGSYTGVGQVLSETTMTSLVAPGGEFGSEQDTADPLGKVDFAFLDV